MKMTIIAAFLALTACATAQPQPQEIPKPQSAEARTLYDRIAGLDVRRIQRA
jgi:hypothetical protein